MNILTEKEINIKSLEKYFYDYACRLAAEAFANYLQALDGTLMKSRDKELLRHKGHRKTCIKTLMGEVEYSRAVYQVMDNECEKKFVYLLDEYVGFENIGFISANLVERIADNICETSYGQTAKNISSLTGQTISHQGVWNVVQKLGTQIEARENRYIELNKEHKLQGKREIAILFEEADGVFVKKQKRYRHKVSNSLAETIEDLTTFAIPEHLQKSSIKPSLSASKAPIKDGKGYEGKHTSMPLADYALSNGRKEIMDWLKGKDFTIPSYF